MSSIVYNGKVFLRKTYKGRYRGRQELHNNGTTVLFNQLCQALLRDFADIKSPKYLDVAYGEGTTESRLTFTSRLRSGRPIEGTLKQSTTSSTPLLDLNFRVLYRNINLEVSSAQSTYLVVRGSSDSKESSYTVSGGDVLMYLKLDNFSMEEGEAQEIFWKLYFQNPQDDTSEEQEATPSAESVEQQAEEVVE